MIIDQRIESAEVGDRLIWDDMKHSIQGIESMNVCVCSFSEERDSLYQWRAYGDSTSGYAIGFNSTHLAAMVKHEDFHLAPCIYEVQEQAAILHALVDEVFEQNVARVRDGELLYSTAEQQKFPLPSGAKILSPRGGSLNAYLHRYAPILKDAAFKEEREWRVISRPQMCGGDRYAYRAGRSMITPYYRLALSIPEKPMKIDEIVEGPTPHIEQSRHSVFSLLLRMDLHEHDPFGTQVKCSAIPYRNW